ncbi:restriction endonuclease subunit S [Nostoc sp. CHAB 5784]|uniref:restriction endonuclease subunit S n=1 Tax=Nostoc mirabile TaxID=2907820 RepID=UPI001E2AD738|nr:restriction endonuclease subunit S [Nostoc mirabile]MCC5667084.1 restriction endonuclease subunit S [Nostoc mirabile CHAB5784]
MREVLVKNQEFKDSPVGKIPTDWEVCAIENKLQQIIDYRGKTPEKTNSGVPLVTAKNVRDGYLDPEPREYIDKKNYDIWMRRGFAKAEDVLFTTEAPLGNVARVPSYKIALAQRLLTLRASPEALDADYLFWLLNWSESRRRLEQKSTGSTVLGIKQSVFRKILFRFPNLPEQRRIAEILDTMDEAIARTSSLIIKLKQTKAGLLQDLLTRGLDNDSKLRDSQAHPEQFKDSALGMIPKEWEVKYLGQVLTSIDAGKSPNCPDIPASGKEWGVLKISAVNPNGFKAEENKVIINRLFINQNYEVKDGDLLITRSNTYELVGLTCLVRNSPSRLLLCDKTLRLNIDLNRAEVEFIFYVLQMPYIRSQIESNATGSSAGMKNISQDIIKKFLVLLPEDLDEQNSITCLLNSYDNRIRTEEAYLNKLKLQKYGLMQDLLTGKVRVKNI